MTAPAPAPSALPIVARAALVALQECGEQLDGKRKDLGYVKTFVSREAVEWVALSPFNDGQIVFDCTRDDDGKITVTIRVSGPGDAFPLASPEPTK